MKASEEITPTLQDRARFARKSVFWITLVSDEAGMASAEADSGWGWIAPPDLRPGLFYCVAARLSGAAGLGSRDTKANALGRCATVRIAGLNVVSGAIGRGLLCWGCRGSSSAGRGRGRGIPWAAAGTGLRRRCRPRPRDREPRRRRAGRLSCLALFRRAG